MTDTEIQALVDEVLANQPDPYAVQPAPYPGHTIDRQDEPQGDCMNEERRGCPPDECHDAGATGCYFGAAGGGDAGSGATCDSLRQAQDRDQQDPMEGLGGPGGDDRSPAVLRSIRSDAVATGLALARAGTVVGIGFCLRETRELLQVGPLWPDATTAWENTSDKHRGQPGSTDPFGVPLWWTNDGPGHVALDIRRAGLCLTTDYVQTGRWGVAPVAELASWCGGTFRGWTGDINGVTVWRKPEPWGRDEKIALVRAALDRARENGAPQRRIDGLRRWLDALKGGK